MTIKQSYGAIWSNLMTNFWRFKKSAAEFFQGQFWLLIKCVLVLGKHQVCFQVTSKILKCPRALLPCWCVFLISNPFVAVFKCFIIMWVPKLFFVRSGLSQQLHWKCQPAVISDQVADKLMFQPLSFTWDDLIICFSPCSLSSLMALLWLLHGTKDHTCVKSHYHNSESCRHAI